MDIPTESGDRGSLRLFQHPGVVNRLPGVFRWTEIPPITIFRSRFNGEHAVGHVFGIRWDIEGEISQAAFSSLAR